MNNKSSTIVNHVNIVLVFLLLYGTISCTRQRSSQPIGYRYISFEKIPRGEWGKVTGTPSWDTIYRIKDAEADSFYVYGNFDSIRMSVPEEPLGSLFRKVHIETKKWKAKPNYDKLIFAGNYVTDSLPGLYASYYFTEDRSSILRIDYSDPGTMVNVILFSKDSMNILKRKSIILDPRDEQYIFYGPSAIETNAMRVR